MLHEMHGDSGVVGATTVKALTKDCNDMEFRKFDEYSHHHTLVLQPLILFQENLKKHVFHAKAKDMFMAAHAVESVEDNAADSRELAAERRLAKKNHADSSSTHKNNAAGSAHKKTPPLKHAQSTVCNKTINVSHKKPPPLKHAQSQKSEFKHGDSSKSIRKKHDKNNGSGKKVDKYAHLRPNGQA
jgi:hypothetical protein